MSPYSTIATLPRLTSGPTRRGQAGMTALLRLSIHRRPRVPAIFDDDSANRRGVAIAEGLPKGSQERRVAMDGQISVARLRTMASVGEHSRHLGVHAVPHRCVRGQRVG